jgi:cytochrome c1
MGRPWQDIARRKYLAGVLQNTPENMALWIPHPQEINPLTAMPSMSVKEDHARDMVAYLYTRR